MTGIHYVYVVFWPHGEPAYVGKGKSERWVSHHHSKKSHPITSFSRKHRNAPRVKVRETLTEAEAFEIEKALIAAIGRVPHGPLLNMTDGGEGTSGFKRTAESVERSANTRRGRIVSEETRRKIGAANSGRKQTPEEKQKRSQSLKGRVITPEAIEKTRIVNIGRKKSDECKEKLRLAFTGRVLTKEHKAKVAAGLRRFYSNPSQLSFLGE